ncbi:MAG: PAS domain S-box protein [bacterium]
MKTKKIKFILIGLNMILHYIPYIILGISLIITFFLWQNSKNNEEKRIKLYFEHKVSQANISIENRMIAYEQMLKAVCGLFINSEEVTRTEFSNYLKTLSIEDNYTGVQGVGYSKIIKPAEKDDHINKIREEGFSDFSIKPAGEREIYTSIIYIEPFTGRNLRVFGYDMYSNPIRRSAMDLACQSGKTFISGKVELLQESDRDKQSGFLMYLPYYKNGFPHNTIQERKKNIAGWIYSPFRMNDLMFGVFGEKLTDLKISIYDEDTSSSKNLMYDSYNTSTDDDFNSRFIKVVNLNIAGRTWIMVAKSLPGIELGVEFDEPLYFLISGILLSIFIFLISNIVISSHKKFEQTSEQNAVRFKYLMEQANTAILVYNMDRQVVEVNDNAVLHFGYSISELLKMRMEELYPSEMTESIISKFELIKSQKSINFETIQLRKDAKHINAEINARLINVGNQNFVLSFVQNISERKIAESELMDSQLWLKSILDSLSSAILIINAETHQIFDANPVAVEMIGDLKENIIGKVCHQYVCPSNVNNCPIVDQKKRIHNTECVLFNVKKESIPIYKTVSTQQFKGKTYLIESIIDISERVQLEKQLIKTRNNFDLFFNTIQDLLFVLDTEGKMLHINNTVCNRLGFKREELIGKSVLEIHPPEYKKETLKIVTKIVKGEIDFCPIPILTKNGVKIPVETRVVQGEWDGKPAIFGVTKDISKLKISEEKFASAFHSGSVIMAISKVDDGTFIEVNEAFINVLGYSQDEIINHTSNELNLFDELQNRQTVNEMFVKNGKVTNIEIIVRKKDNTFLTGLFSADKIMVGDTICWLTSMVDVTELKNALEALRVSENKYRSIFENVQDVFYQTDINGIIIDISPSIEKYSGFSRKDLIGQSVEKVYQSFQEREKLIEMIETKGEVVDYELCLLDKFNNVFITSVNAHFLFDKKGKPYGLEGSLRDITARKNAEVQLQKYAQKLKTVNAEKDKFFSIISHDLRGPLGGICGMLEILVDNSAAFGEEELKQTYRELYKSAKNQSRLLEDLLEWSRIESDRMPFYPKQLKCSYEIEYATELLAASAKSKSITLINKVENDVLLFADSNMLQLVLRNLLTNAIKFSFENSEILIYCAETENDMLLYVQDFGVGIKDENIDKLFKIDVQFSQLGTKKEKGTGLGLVLCKELINKHNGKIWVESKFGMGSRFVLAFPKVKNET